MPNPSATLTETPKTFRLRSSSLPLYRCSSILRCHISRTCRLFLRHGTCSFREQVPRNTDEVSGFGKLFRNGLPHFEASKAARHAPTLPPRSQKRRKRSGYAVVACPCIDVLPSYGVILAALAACSYPAWHFLVSGTSSRNTENVILAALAGYPCWRWRLSVSGAGSKNTKKAAAIAPSTFPNFSPGAP